MVSILHKEIRTFFSSPTAYVVIASFLLVNTTLLWLFNSPWNLPNSGFASLNPFFLLVSRIFIFLVPALCMNSFTQEKQEGTLDILLNSPVKIRSIVLGKFFAYLLLVFIALLPTLLYFWSLTDLAVRGYAPDPGSTIASFFGLMFLAAALVAIGLWASAITHTQLAAFLIAAVTGTIFYYGFEGLGLLSNAASTSRILSMIGIKYHFNSMARGVIDTRDLIYFVSLCIVFLYLCQQQLARSKN